MGFQQSIRKLHEEKDGGWSDEEEGEEGDMSLSLVHCIVNK